MIERAVLIALIAGCMLALSAVGEHFHPIALAAKAITVTSCQHDGWGDATCAAQR